MAKLVVHHDTDPGIAIVLNYTPPGTPGRARGWRGSCTECGHWMHRWTQEQAVETAQRHVDGHEAVLTGDDIDALVRLHARRYGGPGCSPNPGACP